MSESIESDLKKQIFDYMMEQNRPFSANDIFNNMHIDSGKSVFTRALDLLVSEGNVKEKTYGKQKVYFINQDLFDDSEDDLQSLDDKIAEMTNIYIKLQKDAKNLEIKLGDIQKMPTTAEAEEELIAIKAEIPLLQDKLKTLKSKSSSIDHDERNTLIQNKEKMVKEYQRRKRLANNIIDAILDDSQKNKKQLLEEIGIEETVDDSKLQV